MDNLNVNVDTSPHNNGNLSPIINGNSRSYNQINSQLNSNSEITLNPPPLYNPNVNYPSASNSEQKSEAISNHNNGNERRKKCNYVRDRLSIFIDGNNMFYAQQKNNWFFDPRRVLDYFTQDPTVMLINAFWYTGLKDSQDQRGFRDALISLGYTVRTKILKEYYDDSSGRFSQKANLDIEIVVDMFNTVEQYDRVILFSGDGDFERAIELLRSKNTHITVVSTEGMIARELRNATDLYIDLNDIRAFIEKSDY
jgi:uncharacterized LabA/DUF88 family protein